jgi:hypothetical protein
MMRIWGHFARHGVAPADWPGYSDAAPMQMHLNHDISCRSIDDDPGVAMWDEILPKR